MSKWMIVEDDTDIYELMIGVFEASGIESAGFPTFSEAIKWIEHVDSGGFHEIKPELALLDIRLPDKYDGGVLIAERLRKSRLLKDIVIVFMTAYKLDPDVEKEYLSRSGARKIFYKPLPLVYKFVEELKELLEAEKEEKERLEAEKEKKERLEATTQRNSDPLE